MFSSEMFWLNRVVVDVFGRTFLFMGNHKSNREPFIDSDKLIAVVFILSWSNSLKRAFFHQSAQRPSH